MQFYDLETDNRIYRIPQDAEAWCLQDDFDEEEDEGEDITHEPSQFCESVAQELFSACKRAITMLEVMFLDEESNFVDRAGRDVVFELMELFFDPVFESVPEEANLITDPVKETAVVTLEKAYDLWMN